ncbi:M48 family metalloprotease [Haloarchaeobius sp. HRN-SO-5]|uniref:M48 family metalloprotease n=1 Tax=Haloarchaeobius sp. HRN-SO-5 TaxID=3446118 RepID=UPI003EC0250B
MSDALHLRIRMLVAVVGLAVTTLLLCGTIFGALVGVGLLVGVDPTTAVVLAGAFTLVPAAYSVWSELSSSPLDGLDAPRREPPSDLEALVARTSSQLDVPVPAVRVVDTDAPVALVSGLRRTTATLVVSTGVLAALDGDELRAVVAHELAHVANRDVAVTSACAVPVFVADDVFGWGTATLGESPEASAHPLSAVMLLFSLGVGGVFLAVGRLLLVLFTRQRERAADRAAVALTGDPAALAGALTALDERFAGSPVTDLRAADGVETFSIVPPPPESTDPPVMLGPDGDREPYGWRVRRRFVRLKNLLPSSHPATERRIEDLRDASATAERRAPTT